MSPFQNMVQDSRFASLPECCMKPSRKKPSDNISDKPPPSGDNSLPLLTGECSANDGLEDVEVGSDVDVDVVVAGNHVAIAP